MGLFYAFFKRTKSIGSLFLLKLLTHFSMMVGMALTYLGLSKSGPHQQQSDSEEQHFVGSAYVFVMEGQNPSLVPVRMAMRWIKERVPVVEYGSLLERLGTEEEDGDAACSVCLTCIKRSHEIRELSNCSHVFHKECLDRWVDVCQVTCPLCRSMLLPGSS